MFREQLAANGMTVNGQYGYCKVDCSGVGPHCGDGTIAVIPQVDAGNR